MYRFIIPVPNMDKGTGTESRQCSYNNFSEDFQENIYQADDVWQKGPW